MDYESHFSHLRRLAIDKRDAAIARAKEDYEKTLTQIAVLERSLALTGPARWKTLSIAVENFIPGDREFTVADIMAGLEAADPSKVWKTACVFNHISCLIKTGIVKRVRRANFHHSASYWRADLPIPSLRSLRRSWTPSTGF
jgi:hypothetical protein